jgi:hypothetical protein
MVFEQNIANSQNSQAEQLKSFKLVLYDISLNKVRKDRGISFHFHNMS